MRILTAGESHGAAQLGIIEGFPKGVTIEEKAINEELRRRMSGVGRGKRMALEQDEVTLIAGLRNKVTLGSPIAVLVKNKDVHIFAQKRDALEPLSVPRPAHADLAGAFKYDECDLRNILERASARETVSRVAVGSICKQLLSHFKVTIASYTVSVGTVVSQQRPKDAGEISKKARHSSLNCIDRAAERRMLSLIKQCRQKGDTLGGVIEIWASGICPGVGSVMHFDKRLDARLASSLMSIPAIKGVEVGLGFSYAKKKGSLAHDAILYSARKGFHRATNNSGGIEGGISTGEPVVLRVAMKPIATLGKPLDSADLVTKEKAKAPLVRSDTCAIAACGVIAESMTAIAIAEAFLEKFGCDSLKEISTNYRNYCKSFKGGA